MGNERVDKLAKQALKKEMIDTDISPSGPEGKNFVWEKVVKVSQNRHVYDLKKKKKRVGVVESKGGKRREETTMKRLRI